MKTTTRVMDCKISPEIRKPAMQQGIRDRAGAQAWAEKHGYPVVYFMTKKQRVYAERLTVRVDLQAQALEQASHALLTAVEAIA